MFELLATTILPALIPAGSDVVRSVARKVTGDTGRLPQTVDETIKLNQSETDRIKALAELDKPSGNISRWVADLRASFRYIAAGALLVNAFVSPLLTEDAGYIRMSWDGARSAWSFIFGDRMYAYIKRR